MLKNAIIYNADLPPAGTLEAYMVERPWRDIEPTERYCARFVPDDEGILVREFPGGYAFRMRADEKILPPTVLQDELNKAIDLAVEEKGDYLDKEEQEEVKVRTHLALLERALVKTKHTWAFYHQESSLLFVEVATSNAADRFMSELVHTCQVVKTQTINISSISQGVTERLRKTIQFPMESSFGELAFGDYLKLCRKSDGPMEKIVYSDCNILCDEVFDQLLSGYRVEQVELGYHGLEFRLNPKFHLRSMVWPPLDLEVDEESGEVADHSWKVEASKKTAATARLAQHLCSIFEYVPPGFADEEEAVSAEVSL